MRPYRAAQIFIALTALVIAFQLALAAGVPWGELAMGGAFPGQLPVRMRVAAVGSAVLLYAFGAIVASRAGLAFPRWQHASRRLIWLVVAYAVIGVVLNAATPSARERMLWLPVALVLARIPDASDYRPDPRSRTAQEIAWQVWNGTHEFFGKKRPASPMAWSFLFDIVHHRGQITTYLRPMGSTVPQIYGPSADEP